MRLITINRLKALVVIVVVVVFAGGSCPSLVTWASAHPPVWSGTSQDLISYQWVSIWWLSWLCFYHECIDALTTSCLHVRRTTWRLENQQSEFKTSECSYVSIQSYELNLRAKLEYRIKHLRIKHRFHPVSWRERNHHFLNNFC